MDRKSTSSSDSSQQDSESSLSGSPNMLTLVERLKKLYRNQLCATDLLNGTDKDRDQEKIRLLEEYISKLEEQNTMLMQAMIELETEASYRVSLLEERLHDTTKFVKAFVKQAKMSEDNIEYDKILIPANDIPAQKQMLTLNSAVSAIKSIDAMTFLSPTRSSEKPISLIERDRMSNSTSSTPSSNKSFICDCNSACKVERLERRLKAADDEIGDLCLDLKQKDREVYDLQLALDEQNKENRLLSSELAVLNYRLGELRYSMNNSSKLASDTFSSEFNLYESLEDAFDLSD